ncbi:MAG: hypothetical protein RLZZ11_260 [Cyanobacteriota bacterium]
MNTVCPGFPSVGERRASFQIFLGSSFDARGLYLYGLSRDRRALSLIVVTIYQIIKGLLSLFFLRTRFEL